MKDSLSGTLILALAYLILFGTAELIYHKAQVKAEVSRKLVHIMTGVLALSFPFMIPNHWWVLALCGSFFLILISTLNSPFLQSIHGVSRKTSGSLLYPIIVYTCYLAYEHYDSYTYYYLPILILAISDPIAALVGKSFPWLRYTTFGRQKTLSGSLGFFFSTIGLCLALLIGFEDWSFSEAMLLSLFLALACTVLEAISHRGYDNLSIPYGALGILIFHGL